ncbi:Uncharacterised protein [Serratia fonticola]|uniref:Uncharacterized protein n=1 Tax=Serratia fonticola TaxID=47917 RepID=A0A4U9UC61_SERFO|nr:Uncharacterised protein [Serratia fonticola]
MANQGAKAVPVSALWAICANVHFALFTAHHTWNLQRDVAFWLTQHLRAVEQDFLPEIFRRILRRIAGEAGAGRGVGPLSNRA